MPIRFFPPKTTTAARSASTPQNGELLYDTTQKNLYCGDGATVGGKALETKAITTGVKTANYTAKDKEKIPCDTSGGSFSITTPASGRFKVIDNAGNSPVTGFGVNKLTILPASGTTIYGETFLDLTVGAVSPDFELIGTDWRITNHSQFTTAGGATITLDNYFSVTTILDNSNSPIKVYTNDGIRLSYKTVPSQLTFCAWIKTSTARYQLLLTNTTFFATSTSTFPFSTSLGSTGDLSFGIDASDGDFSYEADGATTGLNLIDDTWHHIGIIYKGSDYFKFYADGVQVLNQPIAFSANNPGTLDWCFGMPDYWNSANHSTYGFNGSLAYLLFAPGFADESIITNAYLTAP